MNNWLRRVWHLLNRSRRERELLREMQDHRASMPDPSQFGDTHRLLEESRDAWGWNWLDDAMQDLAVGMRSLMRAPSFTVTAALILTFGIGLNVTLFNSCGSRCCARRRSRSSTSGRDSSMPSRAATRTTVPYPLAEFVKANSDVLAAVLVESQASVAWGKDAARKWIARSCPRTGSTNLATVRCRSHAHGDDRHPQRPSVDRRQLRVLEEPPRSRPRIVGTTAYIDRKPVVIAGVTPENFPASTSACRRCSCRSRNANTSIPTVRFCAPGTADGRHVRPLQGGHVASCGARATARDRSGGLAGAARRSRRSLARAATGQRCVHERWAAHRHLHGAVTDRCADDCVDGRGRESGQSRHVARDRPGARARRAHGVGCSPPRIVRQLMIESVPLVALGVGGSLLLRRRCRR